MRKISFILIAIAIWILLAITADTLKAQETEKIPAGHYKEAYRLYHKGFFGEAARAFEKFSERFDDHELTLSADYLRVRSLGKTDSVNSSAHYESFIARYPNSIHTKKILIELGHRSFRSSDYSQAVEYYERAIDQGLPAEKAAETMYWIAEAKVHTGKKKEARSYYLALADSFPDMEWAPKALYARGRLFLQQNNFSGSSDAFELLRKKYPNHDITRRTETALGESYYKQQKYERAIASLKKSMPYLDDDLKSKAAYLIAESYNYLDNFDEASTYYLRYINWNKGTEKKRKAHYGLGWVYYKQEVYHWAAEQFSLAAEGTDTLARKAMYYEAVNKKLAGQYQEALEVFRRYDEKYEIGYWSEHAYYEWGITAYEVGQYGKTIGILRSLINSDIELEKKAKIYTLLGEAYFANKEYSRALDAFEAAEKVVDIDPTVKREARFQKAWVQYKNQAYKQAQPIFEQIYREAVEKDLTADALFWSADSYYSLGSFGKAADQFKLFTRKFPDHEMAGAAFYSLGWSYFEISSYKKAISPFKTFLNKYEPPNIALFPYNTDTRLRIGDSYYAIGDYDNAIDYYEKSVGAEPGGDYAMFQIANAHYRAGRTYEAVTTFRKLLRIYPYTRLREQAQYNIAYVYFLTDNYEQAIDEFQKVIEKYPNTGWAARSQYSIGDAYYNAGDYEKAIGAYRKVLNQYPDSEYIIDAVNGIQYAQMSKGQEDTSNEVLENFIQQHPRTGMADRLRYRKAENLLQAGQYKEAIKSFNQYLRVTNSEELLPETYMNLAEAYEQTGNMDKSVNAYQTVAEQYPEADQAALALSALGRIFYDRDDHEQAKEYYQRLLSKGDRFKAEAHIGIAQSELESGNLKKAKQRYEEALQVDSENVQARLGMGKIALKRQNYSRSKEIFKKIAKDNTAIIGAEAQYLLGIAYKKQNQCEKAIESFSKLGVLFQTFDKWLAKALLEKAKCQISMERTGTARTTLNDLIDKYPETEAAREASKLLEKRSD